MQANARFFAACRQEPTDRPAVMYWPGANDGRSDAVIVSSDPEVIRHHERTDERAVLAEVPNPYGRAWVQGIALNEILAADPNEGNRILDQFVEETRTAMARSLDAGVDGILYRLHGANAEHCSPMQYGGHYLEHDRALLESVSGAGCNIFFVVGDRDIYLDFVSDLPAHVMGWDDRTSGITAAEGRALRKGAVATFDLSSDVRLAVGAPSVAQMLEKPRS